MSKAYSRDRVGASYLQEREGSLLPGSHLEINNHPWSLSPVFSRSTFLREKNMYALLPLLWLLAALSRHFCLRTLASLAAYIATSQ